MTIVTQYLVGNPERFDETIRRFIAASWVPANTESVTPQFMSPQSAATDTAGTAAADTTKTKSGNAWEMAENKDFVRFIQGETRRFLPDKPAGTRFVRMITFVNIDIFAQTPHRMLLFQEEINRIIHETQPNLSVRITKSNNTQNSAIASFDRTNIEWTPIGEFAEHGIRMEESGSIGCVWQKNKS